ncbi:MAG: hypothetical protein ACNA7W_12705 [Pseudomonadales bacterium]
MKRQHPRTITRSLMTLILAVGAWAFAAKAAAAECECACVDEVAYEVCTEGMFTFRSSTDECSESLQCPLLSETTTETPYGELVEAPEGVDGDLDCRMRNVYRPEIGEYRPMKVCMPAEVASAHERLRARQAEMAQRFQAQQAESDGKTHRGRGPHQTLQN